MVQRQVPENLAVSAPPRSLHILACTYSFPQRTQVKVKHPTPWARMQLGPDHAGLLPSSQLSHKRQGSPLHQPALKSGFCDGRHLGQTPLMNQSAGLGVDSSTFLSPQSVSTSRILRSRGRRAISWILRGEVTSKQ